MLLLCSLVFLVELTIFLQGFSLLTIINAGTEGNITSTWKHWGNHMLHRMTKMGQLMNKMLKHSIYASIRIMELIVMIVQNLNRTTMKHYCYISMQKKDKSLEQQLVSITCTFPDNGRVTINIPKQQNAYRFDLVCRTKQLLRIGGLLVINFHPVLHLSLILLSLDYCTMFKMKRHTVFEV